MANYDFPTEIISLPSQGKCYSEDNPLSKGTLEIKYMTAREEEILASQNLVRKGVVIDKLFESIIVEKDVNIDDIVLGDKNAILLATRVLGYGPEYKIEMTDSLGEPQSVTIDLGAVQTKEVDVELLSSENRYEFTTPFGKNKLEFKILTHGDEKKIDADIKALSRLNKGGVSAELTTRYRFMILSVDGNSDTQSITSFINNKFITRDTKAFREYIAKITPDINMEFDFEDEQTGETEVRSIPMGVGFFWPTE
jgi:hypothetical protein|tara:strand:- start:1588 stop:2346 length:759 start_codon:yes stop_codon:yes gene_type:complete